jgi:kynurenine formamidase
MIETFMRGDKNITLVDLSDRLSNRTARVEPNPHSIVYTNHRESVAVAEELYGLGPERWPRSGAWAIEEATLTTHSGTHVDAPYHYAPESAGQPARTIDQVPLSWCYGDGVVLTLLTQDRVRGITEADVCAELERIGYAIKPFDIVLIRTDASKRFGTEGYHLVHPGLRRDATKWLVEQGVRLLGIDAWGLDRPFDVMAEEALNGNSEQLWESHFFGAEREYCQIEKLCNLDLLPAPYGFRVAAFPVSVEGASAGWSRVVAIFEEDAGGTSNEDRRER